MARREKPGIGVAGEGCGLGLAVDDVDSVHGDTGRIRFGMGTYGSRSIAVGGTHAVFYALAFPAFVLFVLWRHRASAGTSCKNRGVCDLGDETV